MFRLIAALSGAPTAAKEGIFTPSLMSFILSLTPSSVLYCFKATLWEIQWTTSYLSVTVSPSRFLLHKDIGTFAVDIHQLSEAGGYLGNIQNCIQSRFITVAYSSLNMSSGVKSS